MSDFRYNKIYRGVNHGSLIGNWQEEKALRDFTGVGRSIMREHIPKKHLDFENPIKTDKRFDNTVQRIYGLEDQQKYETYNYSYGTNRKSTSDIPRLGRKAII